MNSFEEIAGQAQEQSKPSLEMAGSMDHSGERGDLGMMREADSMKSRKMIDNIIRAIRSDDSDDEDNAIINERKKVNELRGRVVSGLNFDLKVEQENGITQICIINKNGEKKVINDFMPRRYKLAQALENSANFNTGVIEFRKENNPSAMLLLIFHELGHVDKDENSNRLVKKGREGAVEFFGKIGAQINFLVKNKKFYNGIFPLEVDSRFPYYNDDYTPVWYRNYEQKNHAQAERDAWAYALKNFRQLKKEGFNVFDGFNNIQEIFFYINFCLSTYEVRRARLLKLIIGDEENFFKDYYKPLFVK